MKPIKETRGPNELIVGLSNREFSLDVAKAYLEMIGFGKTHFDALGFYDINTGNLILRITR